MITNSTASTEVAAAPRVVALSVSADGLQAASAILAKLPANFPAPIIVAQHLSPHSPSELTDILSRRTALRVKEAKEGDRLQAGTVHVAAPARHLLIRPDETLTLADTENGHPARPAVDVLFSSLASSVRGRAIGVMLAGGDGIGAAGIRAIKAAGGVTLAQNQKTDPQGLSLSRSAAGQEAVDKNAVDKEVVDKEVVDKEAVDFVLQLPEIAATLLALVLEPSNSRPFSASRTSSQKSQDLSAVYQAEPDTAMALGRVQAAWRSAEDYPGDGAGSQPVSRLITKALEELDGCVDALRFAEQVLMHQNRALENYQLALREERLRYQALMEAVTDAVITTDLQRIICAVNPCAARLLGRNPKYMVGRRLERYAQPGGHVILSGAAAQAMRENKTQTLGLRTRSGTTTLCATASVIENERGIAAGLHWLVSCGAPD